MSINSIEIDSEGEKLQEAIQRAQDLRQVPFEDKPRKVMELVREYVNYAYPEDVERLREVDPDKADFVEANLGVESFNSPVKLSQVFDNGFGVCRHLSVATLVLGKEAGLEGVYSTSPLETFGVKNILHPETREKLFKLTGLDKRTGMHAWVEFQVGENWVPVDPSTQLVGDNQQELEIFRQTEYVVDHRRSITTQNLPKNLETNMEGFGFGPGEKTSLGKLIIMPKTSPKIRTGEEIKSGPFTGRLSFVVVPSEDQISANQMKIVSVNNE